MDQTTRDSMLTDCRYAIRQLRKFGCIDRCLDALERVESRLTEPTEEPEEAVSLEPLGGNLTASETSLCHACGSRTDGERAEYGGIVLCLRCDVDPKHSLFGLNNDPAKAEFLDALKGGQP